MPGCNNGVFSEATIAFLTKVPGLIEDLAAGLQNTWLDKRSCMEQAGIHFVSDGNDFATNIRALNSGKLKDIS
ncbi:MAG: hypothetical protein ACI83P_002111 [Janthinobacterium sp.]|jgi:hypothetical protein